MIHSLHRSRLCAAVAVSALAACLPTRGIAGEPAPLTISALSPAAPKGEMLKLLPADQDGLTFRGESARRVFPVSLSAREPDLIRTLQVGFKNTAAALPERSALTVLANGRVLSTLPVNAPQETSVVPVSVPQGTLKAGVNQIEFRVTMTHRVDPSVAATYELWTALDPAKTGFLEPRSPAAPIRSIEDLAAEPLSRDGTTRILVRTRDPAGEESLSQVSRLVDALVDRSGVSRPVVEIGQALGHGPGFDLVLAAADAEGDPLRGLTVVGQGDGLVFCRDPVTDRLVVVMAGADAADLGQRIAEFVSKEGAPRGLPGLYRLEQDGSVPLSALGFQSEAFKGRRYETTLNVALPADFYPAGTDKARLLVDATSAGNLDPNSTFLFAVNDTTVSAISLAPDQKRELRHEAVDLPLRFFHPGANTIRIEAIATLPSDRDVAPFGTPADTRVSLSDTSELVMPHFTRVSTAPQIPGALQTGGQDGPGFTHVYLADPALASAALTMLANRAAAGESVASPIVHPRLPAPTDDPGIVLAPWPIVPAVLKAGIRERAPPRARMEALFGDDPARNLLLPGLATIRSIHDGLRNGFEVLRQSALFAAGLEQTSSLLERHGFHFGSTTNQSEVPFGPRSLLVAAVPPRAGQPLAGWGLPQIAADPRQWLVVTADDAGVIGEGLHRLVADGRWGSLRGRATSLDVDTGMLSSAQPDRITYAMPKSLPLGDLRTVAGGIVSGNIAISLAGLMVLMTILGLSTHFVVRRSGTQ